MHKIVIAKLSGGPGNQMFQYAAGLNLAHRNKAKLYIDITAYDRYKLHGYSLNKLSISAHPITPFTRFLLTCNYRGAGRVQAATCKIMNISRPQTFHEYQFPFNPECAALTDSVILDGYWQSEKYFVEIATTIRKEFEVKPPPSSENSKYLSYAAGYESVFVHVRRGDYVSNPKATKVHGLCPPAYYETVAKIIKKSIKKPVFLSLQTTSSGQSKTYPSRAR
jgi:hypothetical protein